jgi:hypothetical protein
LPETLNRSLDQRLEVGVSDAPENGDRLRHAEGEVEACDRATAAGDALLRLDARDLGAAVLAADFGGDSRDAGGDTGFRALVRRKRTAELVASDRVASEADQQCQL